MPLGRGIILVDAEVSQDESRRVAGYAHGILAKSNFEITNLISLQDGGQSVKIPLGVNEMEEGFMDGVSSHCIGRAFSQSRVPGLTYGFSKILSCWF